MPSQPVTRKSTPATPTIRLNSVVHLLAWYIEHNPRGRDFETIQAFEEAHGIRYVPTDLRSKKPYRNTQDVRDHISWLVNRIEEDK